MKRFHLFLILGLTCTTTLLLWQGDRIRDKEADLRQELSPVIRSQPQRKRPQEASDRVLRTKQAPSPEAQRREQERLIREVKDILTASGSNDVKAVRRQFGDYLTQNEGKLQTASPETLEKILEIITASGIDKRLEKYSDSVAQQFLVLVSKWNPAWAIDRFDQFVATEAGGKISRVLHTMGRNLKAQDSYARVPEWTPEYGRALEKWLNTAQSAGRLAKVDRALAATRFDIAMFNRDLDGVARSFGQMLHWDQRDFVRQIAKMAGSPEERLHLCEQASKVADPSILPKFFTLVAQESGFEAARDILSRSDPTRENRDLAAASIAGANIGPETPARAAWLLGSLQPNQTRAVTHFAALWTEGDFNSTVRWLNSLPQGATRDAAVAGFAPVAARIDGTSAVDWAATVSDPVQREATLKVVTDTWQQIDPSAAADYHKQNEAP